MGDGAGLTGRRRRWPHHWMIGAAMTQYIYTTPLFIIFSGMVLITLIALTMRAIVRREKAMINARLDDPIQIAAYEQRWRGAA